MRSYFAMLCLACLKLMFSTKEESLFFLIRFSGKNTLPQQINLCSLYEDGVFVDDTLMLSILMPSG